MEFATFLGDQGRDAIVVKRIVTLEHFPAIGPTSSIGQVFLGPFYYYLIAPFLLLFNYNPGGLAIGVAFLSIIGLIFSYIGIRKISNKKTADFFLILATFSYVIVDLSRFSWNPNLLPLFSFITLYFFYLLLKHQKTLHAILFGAFLSFSIQLHYLAYLSIIPIFIIILSFITKERQKNLALLKKLLISAAAFLFFYSPLIIFDLKHDFLNSKNLIRMFTDKKIIQHLSGIDRIIDTVTNFFNHVYRMNTNRYVALIMFFGLLIGYFLLKRLKKADLFYKINFYNFFFFTICFSFLNSYRFPHYYGPAYFSFFYIVAYMFYQLLELSKSKLVKIITVSYFLIFILFNIKYSFFIKKGGYQIRRAELVAKDILQENPKQPYQLVALPFTETDDHFRYFLELMNRRPLPADTLADPKELIVLCFLEECNVLNDGQWQIAAFKNKKIAKVWHFQEITIYKIVHGQ